MKRNGRYKCLTYSTCGRVFPGAEICVRKALAIDDRVSIFVIKQIYQKFIERDKRVDHIPGRLSSEDILLNEFDVVSIRTNDFGKRCSLYLMQLI